MWKAQLENTDVVQSLTFFQVPDIKVMFDVVQHFIHVTGDRDVSVRYECADQNTIANQILHALLKSHKFHCCAAASLISLKLMWKVKKKNQMIISNSYKPETKLRSYMYKGQ